MADFRLKLSDGTTTIDLYGGSDALVREGGLAMPPPEQRVSYTSSQFEDGAFLDSARYGKRTITLNVKVWGSTLADLRDNIRSLQRMLNDARERTLLGYGAKYYLELQFGDAANESVFYDLYRGELYLPDDAFSVYLNKRFTLPNAKLVLECHPFGRYTNQDIAQATLENSQTAYVIKDSYIATDDGNLAPTGVNWYAQSFTPGSSFTATHIAAKCYLTGSPLLASTYYEIYATDGAGKPTGAVLATTGGDMHIMAQADSTHIGWAIVVLAVPLALTAGTKYALVCHSTSAGANQFYWRRVGAGGYAGGQVLVSTDSGATWDAVTYAAQDACFAIYGAAAASANYMDVAASAGAGDVPALAYIKVTSANGTGSSNKTTWLAKRSGTRYNDTLWYSNLPTYNWYNRIAITIDAAGKAIGLDVAESGPDGDVLREVWQYTNVGGSGGAVGHISIPMTTIPRGRFIVLARCRANSDNATAYTEMKFGYGYSYGGRTKAPTAAAGELYACSANNTWQVLDLGVIDLPPIAESDIATNPYFYLHIYAWQHDASYPGGTYWKFDVDYVFLLPVDEAVAIVGSVPDGSMIALDGITNPNAVFQLSGGNILDLMTYAGKPFTIGREDTRIYILRDDIIAATFAVDVKYQPRFLVA